MAHSQSYVTDAQRSHWRREQARLDGNVRSEVPMPRPTRIARGWSRGFRALARRQCAHARRRGTDEQRSRRAKDQARRERYVSVEAPGRQAADVDQRVAIGRRVMRAGAGSHDPLRFPSATDRQIAQGDASAGSRRARTPRWDQRRTLGSEANCRSLTRRSDSGAFGRRSRPGCRGTPPKGYKDSLR